MTDPERTIAAQATAAGQGAIAVIRMSGPGCMDILKQCTPAAFTERLRPRRATLCGAARELSWSPRRPVSDGGYSVAVAAMSEPAPCSVMNIAPWASVSRSRLVRLSK